MFKEKIVSFFSIELIYSRNLDTICWYDACSPTGALNAEAKEFIPRWEIRGSWHSKRRRWWFSALINFCTSNIIFKNQICTKFIISKITFQNTKIRDITLSSKVQIVKSYDFSSSHVWIWELDHKEGWAPKNWCFQTVVLEKTLESPLKDSQSILKEISPEYSMEGLMLKLQYFGHLMRRANSVEKTDAGKDWGQEEKGPTEDEMVGWHHWLDGHEFGQVQELVMDREV